MVRYPMDSRQNQLLDDPFVHAIPGIEWALPPDFRIHT